MDEQPIQVSVMCAVYNHEKYIRKALQSFVDQKTNFRFEVLVHDDASTDGSAAIIKEYEEQYPDIIKPIYQTVNQYSQGINIGRTFQFPRAKGKYIAVCEGDDYWTDPNKLQEQFDFMEAHEDYVLIAHGSDIVDESGAYVSEYAKITKTDYEKGELIEDINAFQTASMFYRSDARTKNLEFLNTVKTFDYVFKSVLTTEGKIHIIPKIMSAYRLGSIGSWTQRVAQKADQRLKHLEESIEFFKKLDAYRNGEFHDAITIEMKRREYMYLMTERSPESSRKLIRDHREQFKQLQLLGKISILLSAIGLHKPKKEKS